MRHLLILFTFFSVTSFFTPPIYSQDSTIAEKSIQALNKKLKRQAEIRDSLMLQNSNRISVEDIKRNNRNLDELVVMQRDKEARQKKSLYKKIAIGVAFLLIFIFGVLRSRKKKAINWNFKNRNKFMILLM